MCIHSNTDNHHEMNSSYINLSYPWMGKPGGMERGLNDKKRRCLEFTLASAHQRVERPRLTERQTPKKKQLVASSRSQHPCRSISLPLSTTLLLFLLHVVSAGSITKTSDIVENTPVTGTCVRGMFKSRLIPPCRQKHKSMQIQSNRSILLPICDCANQIVVHIEGLIVGW